MIGYFSAAARQESLATLERTPFDILVIGGGITGAGIARDAAGRGLSVALVERDDFASGTSSRSSRLVHGGIRYLEQGRLRLVFESSRERRTLLRIAPHLVRPLQFVWPLYEGARVPGWKLIAGLLLYDTLALFRNVARHRRLDAEAVAELEPALRQLRLRGGAMYFDAATDDARLTLANARSAAELGATVVNHVEVRKLMLRDGAVTGALAADTLSARTLSIHARLTINACGPWSDDIRRLADPHATPSLRGTKGVHVAVSRHRIRNRAALTLLSPIDGRVIFVLPSGHLTIVGTTDTEFTADAGSARATRDDITYLLRSANAFFPAAHLAPSDVVSAWAGIRPLVGADRDPSSRSREHSIAWTVPGLLTVTGGKLTTYRSMAASAVDAAASKIARAGTRPARTDTTPLPGARFQSLDEELAEASAVVGAAEVAEHLVYSYGNEWRKVWSLVREDAALATPLAPTLPYILAELSHAVEQEMASTLSDLLIRRLHLAFETHDHGISTAPTVARIVAPLLGWTQERIERELLRYDDDIARMFGITS